MFRRFVTTYTGPHTSAGAHLDIDTGEEDNKWGGGNIYLELGDTQAYTPGPDKLLSAESETGKVRLLLGHVLR